MYIAAFTMTNPNTVFTNSSGDSFANGVQLSPDGHTATAWIDDSDADVSVTGIDASGQSYSVAIHTNAEYGWGPYLLFTGVLSANTRVTNVTGVIEQVYIYITSSRWATNESSLLQPQWLTSLPESDLHAGT